MPFRTNRSIILTTFFIFTIPSSGLSVLTPVLFWLECFLIVTGFQWWCRLPYGFDSSIRRQHFYHIFAIFCFSRQHFALSFGSVNRTAQRTVLCPSLKDHQQKKNVYQANHVNIVLQQAELSLNFLTHGGNRFLIIWRIKDCRTRNKRISTRFSTGTNVINLHPTINL